MTKFSIKSRELHSLSLKLEKATRELAGVIAEKNMIEKGKAASDKALEDKHLENQILQKETKKHSGETTGLTSNLKIASKNLKYKEKEIYRLEQTVENAQETCKRLKVKNSELTA